VDDHPNDAAQALAAAMRWVGTDGGSPTPGGIPWCGCLDPDALAKDASDILDQLGSEGWELRRFGADDLPSALDALERRAADAGVTDASLARALGDD